MKKSVKFLVHISFWVVIYLTIRLIYKTLLGDDPWPPIGYHPLWNFEALTICTLVGIAIPFYISYLLFPKFNNGNSKFIWIGLILVFLFVYPAMTTFYLHDVDVIGYSNYSNSFVTYIFFALIGGLFRVFIDWIEQRVKWLFELLFSHQSSLYLDSEVAPKPPTFHTTTVVSNCRKILLYSFPIRKYVVPLHKKVND